MKGSSYSLRVMKNAKQFNKPPSLPPLPAGAVVHHSTQQQQPTAAAALVVTTPGGEPEAAVVDAEAVSLFRMEESFK